jgi:AmmeMemoRadiSam system protein B
VQVCGLSASGADFFSTPLGNVPVDTAAVEKLLQLPQVALNNAAHQPEHCLEVQLPFLQHVLGDFQIVPLLAGRVTPEEVDQVVDIFWDPPENLIVISSDLSHFLDYQTAQQFDSATSAAIRRLDLQDIDQEHACGYRAIGGLISVARRHAARAEILDVRNSGDTSGSRDRVVGYGAYAFG